MRYRRITSVLDTVTVLRVRPCQFQVRCGFGAPLDDLPFFFLPRECLSSAITSTFEGTKAVADGIMVVQCDVTLSYRKLLACY